MPRSQLIVIAWQARGNGLEMQGFGAVTRSDKHGALYFVPASFSDSVGRAICLKRYSLLQVVARKPRPVGRDQ